MSKQKKERKKERKKEIEQIRKGLWKVFIIATERKKERKKLNKSEKVSGKYS